MARRRAQKSIAVTQFKAKCLALVNDVATGKVDRIVLTNRDRPVAALVSLADNVPDDLWGALEGTVQIAPGVDLTAPTGEIWDADRNG